MNFPLTHPVQNHSEGDNRGCLRAIELKCSYRFIPDTERQSWCRSIDPLPSRIAMLDSQRPRVTGRPTFKQAFRTRHPGLTALALPIVSTHSQDHDCRLLRGKRLTQQMQRDAVG